jgi:hypothetical protein
MKRKRETAGPSRHPRQHASTKTQRARLSFPRRSPRRPDEPRRAAVRKPGLALRREIVARKRRGRNSNPRSTNGRQRFSRPSRNARNPRWQLEFGCRGNVGGNESPRLGRTYRSSWSSRSTGSREFSFSHRYESEIHGVDDCVSSDADVFSALAANARSHAWIVRALELLGRRVAGGRYRGRRDPPPG